ncbi:pentatricopeptide repeat (PPR) superfamily protein [Artemisia annua]|uniref:Pentatricopeptide repeat (PPR) superfamily protein n=1 Tax=Artemisia annua TaxID=35608 RepID=A0A2U1LYJ9_ARTAN|nr:pentatricopeptide repeat (PPR) superfamily protein [Artemisia annua]
MANKHMSTRSYNHGKQAHAHVITSGFTPTVFVTNCLIQMYIRCSNITYAHTVFDKMPQRDTVSYNTIVFGYAGFGNMGMAQMIFDGIPARDVVSWNSLVSVYLQNGSCWKCVEVFMWIRREGVKIDATTLAVVLKAYSGLEDYASVFRSCAGLSALRFGSQLHGHSLKMNFGSDTIVGTATLDMYAKCGRLFDAKKLFYRLSIQNLQSYNAIIIGCARVDQGFEAL